MHKEGDKNTRIVQKIKVRDGSTIMNKNIDMHVTNVCKCVRCIYETQLHTTLQIAKECTPSFLF